MYKYVGDISEIAHNIIEKYSTNKDVAIDATLGNGHDCDFLSNNFKKVYAFDIQEIACNNYKLKDKENVIVINDSHHLFNKYINESVDVIMYNLGFLPGNNKDITTHHETSLQSIKSGLELLKKGGIMTIALYIGHSEGMLEKSCIIPYLESLDKKTYGVMIHKFLNRSKLAPMLVVVEKNNNAN